MVQWENHCFISLSRCEQEQFVTAMTEGIVMKMQKLQARVSLLSSISLQQRRKRLQHRTQNRRWSQRLRCPALSP